LAKLEAIADAVRGVARRPAHPVRGTTRRRDVLWSDLVAFVRELPAVLRAVVAGVRVARAEAASKPPRQRGPRPVASRRDGPFRAPAACVRVDLAAWDAVAERLG